MEKRHRAPREEVEAAVRSLLARHHWQLLAPEEFVARTWDALDRGAASNAVRAATHVYALALYEACSGAEGDQRQETAYHELFHYLYRSAHHRYRDVSEDATQLAIERIFVNFERCREPAAFLAWAFQQLRAAARTLRRQEKRPVTTSLDAPHPTGPPSLLMLLPAPLHLNPAEQVVQKEVHARLSRMVTDFLTRHPRAEQQLTAFLLKHLWGMDDATIGLRLEKSVESVYVLRARAKKKLQQEQSWIALASELGVV